MNGTFVIESGELNEVFFYSPIPIPSMPVLPAFVSSAFFLKGAPYIIRALAPVSKIDDMLFSNTIVCSAGGVTVTLRVMTYLNVLFASCLPSFSLSDAIASVTGIFYSSRLIVEPWEFQGHKCLLVMDREILAQLVPDGTSRTIAWNGATV